MFDNRSRPQRAIDKARSEASAPGKEEAGCGTAAVEGAMVNCDDNRLRCAGLIVLLTSAGGYYGRLPNAG